MTNSDTILTLPVAVKRMKDTRSQESGLSKPPISKNKMDSKAATGVIRHGNRA